MIKKLSTVRVEAAEIYVLIMLVIFPLFMPNGYLGLFQNKWELFLFASSLMMAVIFLSLVPFLLQKNNFFRQISLSSSDKWILAYFLAVLISYVGSSYKKEAFWGVETWNLGLVTQVLLVFIYFTISRLYRKSAFIEAAAGASWLAACILLILQRFGLDVFWMYRGFPEEVKLNFVTTTGQVTWGSAYLTIGLCYCTGLYMEEENKKRRGILALMLAIGVVTIAVQNCDSAIIGVLGVMAVLIWRALKKQKMIERLLEILLLSLGALALTGLAERLFMSTMIPIDSMYLKIAQSLYLYPLFLITGALRLLFAKGRLRLKEGGRGYQIARGIYAAVLVCGAVGTVMLFILHTTGRLPDSPYNNYFYISDWWGNSRGFIWKTGAAVYGDFNIWRKLFGCGPDSFTFYANDLMGESIRAFWSNQIVPNVHNEWFNALINYGLAGGLSYIGFFLNAAIGFVSNKKRNPASLSIGLAVTAYIFHNILCYQQIIAAPIIIILIAMGEAQKRKPSVSLCQLK